MFSKKQLVLLLMYLLFSQPIKAQHLFLTIDAENQEATEIIDSLDYANQFSSYQDLSSAIDSLFLQVQKMGFLDVQTLPLKKINDSLYFSRFTLGQKYDLLRIYYTELPLEEKIIKNLSSEFSQEYFSIPFIKTKEILSFLNQQIANQGRPFSFLQLKNIRKGENDILLADLQNTPSNTRTIDEVVIKGYEKFPRSFLKHFIGIKIGQPFNKKRLEEKVERLHNLPFAGSIRPPEVQFTKDSTSIYLYLEKEKSNTFEGFLGFSNDENENKLKLTGDVNVVLRNNLNYGETLNLHYKSSGDGQTKFNAAVDLPFLFQTPIGLNLGLDIFKKDSSYVSIEQQAKINYRFNAQITTFVGYRHTESNNLLDEPSLSTGSIHIEDYTANYISLGGQFLDYNDFSELFPIKSHLALDFSYGNRDRMETTSSQWIVSATATHIFQLNERNSVYVQNESSVLTSNDYLSNELFRFGGINSIRGFAENSIFASLYTASQTEYRYLLSQNLYVNTIIDHAYYENKTLDLNENLYGIGFGLGVKTGAGTLRLSFANGKADGQNFEFSNTKIHLGLVSVF